MEDNCSSKKVDWLAAFIALRLVGAVLVPFLRRWRKICTNLQPIGSKGRYLKNVPSLLTSKKQGNLDYVHVDNIIKPTKQTRINREKDTFCIIKSFEQLKN